MRILDKHSHWETRRGYPFHTPEELAQQEKVFRSTPRYITEAEMAEYFRRMSAQVMLDLGVRAPAPIEEVRALRDTGGHRERRRAAGLAPRIVRDRHDDSDRRGVSATSAVSRPSSRRPSPRHPSPCPLPRGEREKQAEKRAEKQAC